MIVAEAGNYTQFYSGISQLANDDVMLLVTDTITFPSVGYDVDWGSRDLYILGVTGEAEFDFSACVFAGNYAATANGLAVGCRDLAMAGIRIRDHQTIGDVIKPNVTRIALLAGNEWQSCGSTWWPYRPGVAAADVTVNDAVYSTCIGSHVGGTSAVVIPIANHFTDCCTQEGLWSHCIYASGVRTFPWFNTFKRCGNPFSIYPPAGTDRGIIFRNAVLDPALCQRPSGPVRPDVLSGMTYELAFINNHLRGVFANLGSSLTSATAGHTRFWSDYNVFDRMLFNGVHIGNPVPTAFSTIDSAYKTLQQWLAMGYEAHKSGTPVNVTIA